MALEGTCSACGYVGVWPRGQAIDWIAAVFALILLSPHMVEAWRDLLHPRCPQCLSRNRETHRTSIFPDR